METIKAVFALPARGESKNIVSGLNASNSCPKSLPKWYTVKIQDVLVPLRPVLNKPIQVIFDENETQN